MLRGRVTFTIQWTPSGGLPVVYDCYRATVTRPRNIYLAQDGLSALMITCRAKPFGRTPFMDTSAASGGASLEMDSFDSATGLTGATISTAVFFDTPGSAQVTFNNTNPGSVMGSSK